MQPTPTPPLADPNAKPQRHFAGAEVREFRVRLWLYFLPTWVTSVFTAVLLIPALDLLRFGQLRQFAAPDVWMWLVIATVLMLAMCAFIWRFMPLKVGRWGLRAYTIWMVPQEVAWPQIARVRYFWLLYPYVVISCPQRPTLWVWLALDDTREFAASVAAFTAPDHPLHAFLARRGLINSIEPPIEPAIESPR